MLVSDIIAEARIVSNDPNGVRWQTPSLIMWVNDFLDTLWHRQRSAFYVAAVITAQPAAMVLAGDPVPVLSTYKLAGAHFLCHRSFLNDSEASENQELAKLHLSLFEKELGL